MTDVAEMEIPKGFMADRDGNLIKKELVKDVDLTRDKLVKKLIKSAQPVANKLAEFKASALADIDDFVAQSLADHGAKIGGKKGNIKLYTFDGKYMIDVAVSDTKGFDERLQIARSLIDECIKDWMKGSNKNIQAIVQSAFQVDKQGKISVDKVLGLRKLKIEDERWEKAMAAISDSIQIVSSKRYIRLYERNADGDGYTPISLDAASA